VIVKKCGYWRIIAAVALVAVLACGCAGGRGAIGDAVDHGGSLVSKEGQIAFARATSFDPNFEADIYTINVDGSLERRVTDSPDLEGFPNWSPDGKRTAFATDRDGNWELYVMDSDGAHPRRLTNTPEDEAWPAWSPDGETIAFTSDGTEETGEIYVMNADGSGLTRLTDDPAYDAFPAWRP
jgi:Tol biopolymer transport system component